MYPYCGTGWGYPPYYNPYFDPGYNMAIRGSAPRGEAEEGHSEEGGDSFEHRVHEEAKKIADKEDRDAVGGFLPVAAGAMTGVFSPIVSPIVSFTCNKANGDSTQDSFRKAMPLLAAFGVAASFKSRLADLVRVRP